MATKVQFEIDVNDSGASKSVDNLSDSVEDLGDNVDNTNKKLAKTEKESKGMSKQFAAVGTAIKGMGIGVAMVAFAGLTDAMRQNQKVADTLNVFWGTLGNTFSRLVGNIIEGKGGDLFTGGAWVGYIAGAKTASERTNELNNEMALSGAELGLNKAKTEKLIEVQRQIRDDVNNSVGS
jgi:uncharacterized protein YoxC